MYTFFVLLSFSFSHDSSANRPYRVWGGGLPQRSPSLITNGSVNISVAFGTSGRVLPLAVCWSSVSHCVAHGWQVCAVLLDPAALLWGGSRAYMHAVAEGRISVEVTLCLTSCQACCATSAQRAQCTSFTSANC